MRNEILKTPPVAQPQVEAQPAPPQAAFISANEAVVNLLLAEANEPKPADAKKLATLDAEWLAHLDDCAGYGYDDALHAHRAWCHDFRQRKNSNVPPAKDELIRQYAERRRLLKQSAVTISENACEIVAQVYERSLGSFDKLRNRIATQETAIFPQTEALGKSPLLRMVDDLPRTLKHRIEKLRIKGANRRPGNLITK